MNEKSLNWVRVPITLDLFPSFKIFLPNSPRPIRQQKGHCRKNLRRQTGSPFPFFWLSCSIGRREVKQWYTPGIRVTDTPLCLRVQGLRFGEGTLLLVCEVNWFWWFEIVTLDRKTTHTHVCRYTRTHPCLLVTSNVYDLSSCLEVCLLIDVPVR